jgi:hypothetical protein
MSAAMLQLHGMNEERWYPWEEEPVRRRGRAWLWIGLPMFIGLVAITGIVVVVLRQGFGSTQIWADISLVFVLFPLCFMGVIPLLLLIGLSYGLGRLVGWLPAPMRQLDGFLQRAARETHRGSDQLARPLMVVQGIVATIDTFLRGLIELLR